MNKLILASISFLFSISFIGPLRARNNSAALLVTNSSLVHFSSSVHSINEIDGIAVIEVSSDNNSLNQVSVDYATSDDTATAGQDYTAVSGTLTFPVGQSSTSFTVPIFQDSMLEGDETVLLTLNNPIMSPQTAELTIHDSNIAMRKYFPITPGSVWQYADNGSPPYAVTVPFESIRVNNNATNTMKFMRSGVKQYYSNDAQGIALNRLYIPRLPIAGIGDKNATLTASPPIVIAPEIATIGQTSYSTGIFHLSAPGVRFADAPYTANFTVQGYETVTVPVGTYDTVKLQGFIYINGQLSFSQLFYLAKDVGIVKLSDLISSVQAELLSTNTQLHDMAVTKLNAPVRVTFSPNLMPITKNIKVSLQNRGPLLETIPDMEMLKRFVHLNIESLGSCPVPQVALKTVTMPLLIKPKQNLIVDFIVPFDCANDLDVNTAKNTGHEDYRYTVSLNYSLLDGETDGHPSDDICPRTVLPPYIIDTYSGGKFKDYGCGSIKADRTFGGLVVTDLTGP